MVGLIIEIPGYTKFQQSGIDGIVRCIECIRTIDQSIVYVIHHNEETCPFQMKIGIYIDNGIAAYLHLIIGWL